MTEKINSTTILALQQWLQEPAGQYVLQWEQTVLDQMVADIFGYHAAQYGLPVLQSLRQNRMPHRFNIVAAPLSHDVLVQTAVLNDEVGVNAVPKLDYCVVADAAALPFDSGTLDLLVLPHVLEFAADPHAVLREAERVLIAQGHLIVTGFNPASLWGARQILMRKLAEPFLPSEGQFISMPRLKDWLKLLEFEIDRGKFGCYAPAVRSQRWLGRWQFMDRAGERWWPFLGSVYCVHAIKQVPGMRLIGPAWKDKKQPRAVRATVAAPNQAPKNAQPMDRQC